MKNEKGSELEFHDRKYLLDLYKATWSYPKMVIKKSAQVGVTTFALTKAFWLCDNYQTSVIFTMPTHGDVSIFSQTRINPMLKSAQTDNDIGIDNVSVKQIGNSFIYLRGAWTEKQALSIPSDYNIHDEIDFSKPDIREMYEERLSASDFRWQLDISTPTIPNYGISKEFEETTKNLWVVDCRACGHRQEVKIDNIIDEEYRCLKCKEILDRENGKWEAQQKSEVAGFHITQLMAGWLPASEILRKRERYIFKRDFFNFVLGEEYYGGEEMVTRADILALLYDGKEIPDEGTKTAVGIDWGDISWAVVRRGNTILHIQKITGDTRTHPKQVAELMEKFNAYAVCDFGYGDTKNKALIDWFPKKVWQCLYTAKTIFPRFDDNDRKVHIDRTLSLKESFEEIKAKGVRIVATPEINVFISHFGNMVEKKSMDEHGQMKEDIQSAGDDHYAHAYNYARLLFIRKNQADYSKWSVISV